MVNRIKKEIYSVEEILPRIDANVGRIKLGEDWVRVGSMRLQMFKIKGVKCVSCGIEGKFFRKEVQSPARSGAHYLNLYAVGKYKQHVLMTKDHIFPQSKGGRTILENLQPMCDLCNNRKQDKASVAVWFSYKLREFKRYMSKNLLRKLWNANLHLSKQS